MGVWLSSLGKHFEWRSEYSIHCRHSLLHDDDRNAMQAPQITTWVTNATLAMRRNCSRREKGRLDWIFNWKLHTHLWEKLIDWLIDSIWRLFVRCCLLPCSSYVCYYSRTSRLSHRLSALQPPHIRIQFSMRSELIRKYQNVLSSCRYMTF